jgi:hypothetical protein
MRTKKHYENLLNQNPNTTVGFTLAAQAVYAAKNGTYPGPNESDGTDIAAWKSIASELKSKYGENLTVEQVRDEMAAVTEPTAELIVRKIPESLRRDFKSKCAADGISQQDKIIELMRQYVNQ